MADVTTELIAAQDGRYFSIFPTPTGGIMSLAKTEKLTDQFVSFGVPSSAALFLNIAHRAYAEIRELKPQELFYKWQNTRVPVNNSELFDYFEKFASHVVFSLTALEAFANEMIPDAYEYQAKKKGAAVVLKKPEIERTLTLEEKLNLVLPKALGVPTPSGKRVWEQFKKLKGMRDRIIHLKAIDRSASGPEVLSLWGIMLRAHGEPFCDYAHAMMGHFFPSGPRRWHREYPYQVREPDKFYGDVS